MRPDLQLKVFLLSYCRMSIEKGKSDLLKTGHTNLLESVHYFSTCNVLSGKQNLCVPWKIWSRCAVWILRVSRDSFVNWLIPLACSVWFKRPQTFRFWCEGGMWSMAWLCTRYILNFCIALIPSALQIWSRMQAWSFIAYRRTHPYKIVQISIK